MRAVLGIACMVAAALLLAHLARAQATAAAGCVTLVNGRDSYCEMEVWGERPVITAGSNRVLLANVPAAGSVRIYRNGLRMAVVSDYNQAGQAITFTVPLAPDDTLVVDYRF